MGASTASSYLTGPLIFRMCFSKNDVSVNVGGYGMWMKVMVIPPQAGCGPKGFFLLLC